MGKHSVEKPQVPASILVKAVSENSGYTQKEVKDILNVYYDTIFDFIVDNKEIHIPGIGRIWISDPKPHRYWDERAGKIQHTITYPVLKFKPVKRFKDSLHGEVFRQMKEEYKARIAALEAQETDREFEKVFNPPKRKTSKKKTSK